MIDYDLFLDEYSFIGDSLYSSVIPERERGNKEAALEYLKKYYLPKEEYVRDWKPIQDSIFQNEDIGCPEKRQIRECNEI